MAGIDAKNKHALDQKFICFICSLILQFPLQLIKCGHRFCQSCLNIEQITPTQCPACQEETLRSEILPDRGFMNEMKTLPIECSFCQWKSTFDKYQEHLVLNHPTLKCEFCGEDFTSVDEFNQHKIFQCQNILIDCFLKDFGCNEQIIRSKKEEHYLTEQHQQSIVKAVRALHAKFNDRMININDSRITTTDSYNPDIVEGREIEDTLDIVGGGIETLANDQQRISNESLQLQLKYQALTEQLSNVKLSVEESNLFLDAFKCNQDILKQDLTSIQETVNDIKYVSYDGTLIWKIPNVREKMMDAQSERQTSIYSPPFYSSPTGYKMRARLYLNGDGNARRTHLSIFIVIMRSPNDAILKFPFTYKVTFSLYDQTPAQRHIIDSFRPDVRSTSFQRPRSDMNIASGIPKFFPLEMIQKEDNPYVRDDAMFIKVLVDFGDMPKTLLPYALSLNPGLPTEIQQIMICQEAERRAQVQSNS